MKTFLLRNSDNKPIINWGCLLDNTFFESKEIPEGYSLAISPNEPYIVIDVDRHEEDKDGFRIIPDDILQELESSFNYPTKNNGKHYWFKYLGDKQLPNKASGFGIDLRIGSRKGNCGGYVKWHPRDTMDIRNEISKIKETSPRLNQWLEDLFFYKHNKK